MESDGQIGRYEYKNKKSSEAGGQRREKLKIKSKIKN